MGIILFSMVFCLSSCNNVFSDLAAKDTDKALYFAAKMDMNNRDWTSAIAKFEDMSDAFLAEREVAFNYASAYAGRCGLDFLNLADIIDSAQPTDLFLKIMMNSMPDSSATTIDDCKAAEAIITATEPVAANRTPDENIFMAFLSLSKMGAILNLYADTDNNGTPDGGFDACNAGSIPDGNASTYGATHVAASLNIAVESLVAANTTIAAAAINAIDQACTAINSVNATYNFCGITDPTAITGNKIKGIRSLIGEGQAAGIGSCAASPNSIANCACP